MYTNGNWLLPALLMYSQSVKGGGQMLVKVVSNIAYVRQKESQNNLFRLLTFPLNSCWQEAP